MDPKLTLEKVIEHHLSQNMGQKITPHLVTGLAVHIGQNIRKLTGNEKPTTQSTQETDHG